MLLCAFRLATVSVVLFTHTHTYTHTTLTPHSHHTQPNTQQTHTHTHAHTPRFDWHFAVTGQAVDVMAEVGDFIIGDARCLHSAHPNQVIGAIRCSGSASHHDPR